MQVLRLFLVCLLLVGSALCFPEESRVKSLPGYEGDLKSEHYAGYVTVDKHRGRHLYYYLVLSERDPVNDPLVLWLNGGPGCSSFDGFIYEHGPFKFSDGASPSDLPVLKVNPYSWSKVSSIVYVDSPAFVGLSYSETAADVVTDDLKTARDTHALILSFLTEYPEFQSNDFWIAGESYGGIYVPSLAREVAQGIERAERPKVNFKGYMVGNGCTDPAYDGNAIVPFIYGHGLIDIDLYKEAEAACGESYWNSTDQECLAKLAKIDFDVRDVNIYDIIDMCHHTAEITNPFAKRSKVAPLIKLLRGGPDTKQAPLREGPTIEQTSPRVRMFGRGWPLRAPVMPGRVPTWPEISETNGYVPCVDDHVATKWLNDKAVREALHAKPVSEIGPWFLCTPRIEYYHNAGSMVPIHRNLTQAGYRVLIYSGDNDMCVPYTGSEAWTRGLGYPVLDEWRPWYIEGQVAGYTRQYDHGLTFATIKGSGHTVPEYKPAEALAFYKRFLEGKPL